MGKQHVKAVRRRRLRWLVGMLVTGIALVAAAPARGGQSLPNVVIEHHTVNTSFAAGTITYPPDLWRPDEYVVRVGTWLTDELVDLIGQTRPEVAGPGFAPLLAGVPVAPSNLEFFTGDLMIYGNAGHLIVNLATTLADALTAEACGTFQGIGVATYTGKVSYSLDGGTLGETGTRVDGTVNVAFYTVQVEITRTSSAGCPPLEHFLTYESKVSPGQPPQGRADVLLQDPFFETGGPFRVEKLELLANPVDKNGEGVENTTAHLLGYKVKADGEKLDEVSGVAIENQLGTLILDVRKPRLLLTPAAKRHLPIGDELPPVPASLGHFLCYDVTSRGQPVDPGTERGKSRKSRKSAKSRKGPDAVELLLVDQFTGPVGRTYDLKQPRLLCSPVAKTVAGPDGPITSAIGDPETFLTCYDVKPIPVHPPQSPFTVWTRDQFGDRLVETKKERHLCVPSTATRPDR